MSIIVLSIGIQDSGDDADRGGWIKLVIGLLFLTLAVKQWRDRPRDGDEPEMPGWMASIDEFTAAKAFGMAVLLSGVNPKNFGVTVAAAAAVGSFGLETGEETVVVVVYVAIASITLRSPSPASSRPGTGWPRSSTR